MICILISITHYCYNTDFTMDLKTVFTIWSNMLSINSKQTKFCCKNQSEPSTPNNEILPSAWPKAIFSGFSGWQRTWQMSDEKFRTSLWKTTVPDDEQFHIQRGPFGQTKTKLFLSGRPQLREHGTVVISFSYDCLIDNIPNDDSIVFARSGYDVRIEWTPRNRCYWFLVFRHYRLKTEFSQFAIQLKMLPKQN